MMMIKIYPENPNQRAIIQVVNCLQKGGIIIYPTDTIYGLGCDISQQKAIERLCEIKGLNPEKAHLSFICYDLSHLSDFTKSVDTSTFRILKSHLPGPFTFILPAGKNTPKLLNSSKKTVGIRIPDHAISREIVHALGHPTVSTSLHDDDDILEYSTDPELIYEKYKNVVDLVIDGGYGENTASTVVDCTSGSYEILRQGKGILKI